MNRRGIKKSSFMFFIVLVIAISLIAAGTITVSGAEVTLTTNTTAGLQAAINNAGTTPTTIKIEQDISLSASVKIPAGADISLESDQDSRIMLTRTSQRHIQVIGKLTLKNIILDGSTGQSKDTAAAGGVQVDTGAEFILEEGASIQNCKTSHGTVYVYNAKLVMNGGNISNCVITSTSTGYGGGGVEIKGESAIFDMIGGIINGNAASRFGSGVFVSEGATFNMQDGAVIKENSSHNEGGAMSGGGVYLAESTFNMEGGLISGNKISTGNSACSGAGIFARSSTVTMQDGAIIKDNVTESVSNNSYGAGIYLDGTSANPGIIDMQGGQIAGNKSISTSTTSGNNIGGGGVLVRYGSFTMHGGTIENNELSAGTATSTSFGAGVYATYLGNFIMEDGKISGNINTSPNSKCGGGGVSIDVNGKFTMNGGEITENTARYGGGLHSNGPVDFNGGEIIGNGAVYGGGVSLGDSSLSANIPFTMKGGKISGNSANTGAGVYASAFGNYKSLVNLYNGEISDNGKQQLVNGTDYTQSTIGGGVYLAETTTIGSILNMGDSLGLIAGTPAIKGNIAKEDGGGVYLTKKAAISTFGGSGVTSIVNNTATEGNGGGIFTADTTYANIKTDVTTEFSGNTAVAPYVPPTDADTLYPDINFASVSAATHPINNYDINYTSSKILTHHITYDANGGSGGFTGPEINARLKDTVLPIVATGIANPNHDFSGWNTKSDGTGISYNASDEITMNSNITLYAQWDKQQFTVTFESSGGSDVASQTVTHGAKAVEPQPPTKTDYQFLGWYTDNNTFEDKWDFETDTITDNITVYAGWKEIPTTQPSTSENDNSTSPTTEESEKSTNNGESSESSEEQDDVPRTGDTSNMALWFILLAVAVIVFVILIIWRKKENKK